MENFHKDCSNYLAIDVFKGFCKIDDSRINADDHSCEKFEAAAQCRNCKNYTVVEEFSGLCMGKADAYPNMPAKTCNDYLKIA